MFKKWCYPIFFVLLFLGIGNIFALENEARGTDLVNAWKENVRSTDIDELLASLKRPYLRNEYNKNVNALKQ